MLYKDGNKVFCMNNLQYKILLKLGYIEISDITQLRKEKIEKIKNNINKNGRMENIKRI